MPHTHAVRLRDGAATRIIGILGGEGLRWAGSKQQHLGAAASTALQVARLHGCNGDIWLARTARLGRPAILDGR